VIENWRKREDPLRHNHQTSRRDAVVDRILRDSAADELLPRYTIELALSKLSNQNVQHARL